MKTEAQQIIESYRATNEEIDTTIFKVRIYMPDYGLEDIEFDEWEHDGVENWIEHVESLIDKKFGDLAFDFEFDTFDVNADPKDDEYAILELEFEVTENSGETPLKELKKWAKSEILNGDI
jgi:hypothetical protein